MHAHSLAHRDLHPGNLLYDRSADRIILTDFGLSAYCAPGQHFFGRVGTEGATCGGTIVLTSVLRISRA